MRKRYFGPEDFDMVERLEEVAKEKGVKPARIAMAWLLSKPEIKSPIVGPTKVGRLEEIVAGVETRLEDDDLRRLEELFRVHPVLGHE